ncbi:MAG: hypothetical protein KGI98_07050 [Euryarchaeota archaeon]|nr:hypothetical protein [Euryarchaeota archaeon]
MNATPPVVGSSAAGVPPLVRRNKPPLYRLARLLRWSGILAVLIVVLYLVASIVSLAMHPPQVRNGAGAGTTLQSSEGLVTSEVLYVWNNGSFPMTFSVGGVLALKAGGLLAEGSSSSVTVSPGTEVPINVHVLLPTRTLQQDGYLLYRSVPTVGWYWINGSYASMFDFGLAMESDQNWSAPYQGFTVTPGTPTTSGGNTIVPVRVNFTNEASYADTGALTLSVLPAGGGTSCGGGSLSLAAAPGSTFDQTTDITVASGCNLAGGQVVATITSGAVTVTLPPEPLP